MIYGLWYGGASYSVPDPRTDLELFASITDARDTLRDRYDSNGKRTCAARRADGTETNVCYPAVDSNSEIHLYMSDPRRIEGGWYPDRRVFFGPRGGVRVEDC